MEPLPAAEPVALTPGAALAPPGPAGVSPAEELGTLIGWAAALFYLAESDVNPGVTSYWDALHYITTALSVGYANIFPMTPLGKTIGSVVMTVGPALSARVFDATRETPPAQDLTPVVQRLDAILRELSARPIAAGETSQ